MRILTTCLPASSGYAWLAGFDVMYQSMEVRKRIGYLPESVPLYPEMRVREYLSYRAKLKGVERAGRTARIDYCLEKCRIKEVQNRLLGTLSKGYRQRVGLADAMLADPPILILDEPTSGLDPVQISETLNTIRELGGQHTVLLSTHILSEVEKVCERVIIINKGRIKFDDTLKSIADREPMLRARGPRPGRGGHRGSSRSSRSVASVDGDAGRRRPDGVRDQDEGPQGPARGAGRRGWRRRAGRIRRLDLRRVSLEDAVHRGGAAAGRGRRSRPGPEPPNRPRPRRRRRTRRSRRSRRG